MSTPKTAPSVTEQEKQWRIEENGRTLLRAEEIKADAKRLKPALAWLKQQKKAQDAVLAENTKSGRVKK